MNIRFFSRRGRPRRGRPRRGRPRRVTRRWARTRSFRGLDLPKPRRRAAHVAGRLPARERDVRRPSPSRPPRSTAAGTRLPMLGQEPRRVGRRCSIHAPPPRCRRSTTTPARRRRSAPGAPVPGRYRRRYRRRCRRPERAAKAAPRMRRPPRGPPRPDAEPPTVPRAHDAVGASTPSGPWGERGEAAPCLRAAARVGVDDTRAPRRAPAGPPRAPSRLSKRPRRARIGRRIRSRRTRTQPRRGYAPTSETPARRRADAVGRSVSRSSA